jgi:radical SAM/Cys-rich protein
MMTKSNLFKQTLEKQSLTLCRERVQTLQVNVGLLCDLACKHCHVEAGPNRTEVMDRATMDAVIAFAKRHRFAIIDITGGAPELVPEIDYLLRRLVPLTGKLMLRTNLTALDHPDKDALLDLFVELKIALVASFPSTSPSQADSQRGKGVLSRSVIMLQRLNKLGYGQPDSGLELNLVANPTGAFLPDDQSAAEQKFKGDALRKWGIVFNSLFTFANMPLGRFRHWLERSGNLDDYMETLQKGFNPCTVNGLMCRSLLSVDWNGQLYDCDFNLAAGIPLGGQPLHVSDCMEPPEGEPIATGDHCFACTVGSGFT